MVTVTSLEINQSAFLCLTFCLPSLTTHVIYCTKGILFDEYWDCESLEKKARVPICQSKGRKVEELLEHPIIFATELANRKGVYAGMKGQEALLLMLDEN